MIHNLHPTATQAALAQTEYSVSHAFQAQKYSAIKPLQKWLPFVEMIRSEDQEGKICHRAVSRPRETNLAVREMRKISIIDDAPGLKQAKKLFLKRPTISPEIE